MTKLESCENVRVSCDRQGISMSIFETVLSLTLSGEYYANDWSTQFGDIQTVLKSESIFDQNISEVNVDFTNCDAIEPLPLLSLLISLVALHKAAPNVMLKFVFNKSKVRLMAFIQREGFADIINDSLKATTNVELLVPCVI